MSGYLTGKLVVGIPRLHGQHPVVFICGQDREGAIGLIVNQPMASMELAEFLKQLDITPPLKESILHYGGPLEVDRGFVLHTLDFHLSSTVRVETNLGVTSTIDILKAISKGLGPSQYLVALGYTGWDSGQLEQEIQGNQWIVTDANHDLLFGLDLNMRWKMALTSIGISNPLRLSPYGGCA